MIDKERIRELVPHAGSMCLIDRVERWSETEVECSTHTHLDPQHPLRNGGALSAIHLAEYAAQSTAIHGALTAHAGARPGVLGAIRDFKMYVSRIDDLPAPLLIRAVRKLAQQDGMLYDFEVYCGEREIASGRVAVVLTGKAEKALGSSG